jgi:predicted ATP-dependent endonuclease of OLD family
MTENFENKISRLTLSNFTCFSQADFEFSAGINVFIGENGTGKTHILKCLFALLKKHYQSDTWVDDRKEKSYDGLKSNALSTSIIRNLKESFKSHESTNALIRQKEKRFDIQICIDKDKNIGYFHEIGLKDNNKGEQSGLTPENSEEFIEKQVVFIPTLEMLSNFSGFASSYEKRETPFDITYYYLAKDLEPLVLKDINGMYDLVKELEHTINGKVIRKGNEFYIKFSNLEDNVSSGLVATGINKIAQLIYLIMNGSLTKESILFWDEPEVNLNPKYISLVAKFLQTLSKAGVQVFVATHDYLLIHQLSLAAEYRAQTDAPAMKFFSLTKGDDGTVVESGATLVEINNNAILDEYAAFYDLENSLFAKSRP